MTDTMDTFGTGDGIWGIQYCHFDREGGGVHSETGMCDGKIVLTWQIRPYVDACMYKD